MLITVRGLMDGVVAFDSVVLASRRNDFGMCLLAIVLFL